MTLHIVLAGAVAAVSYNLLTLAVACWLYRKPGGRLDWAQVAFNALLAGTVGGYIGLLIALIMKIIA